MDELALRRLVVRGKAQGSLGVEDLQRELPLRDMPPEELARTVEHLEQAGVEIRILPELMAGPPRRPIGLNGAGGYRPDAGPASDATPQPLHPVPRPATPETQESEPPAGRAPPATGRRIVVLVLVVLVAVLVAWALLT